MCAPSSPTSPRCALRLVLCGGSGADPGDVGGCFERGAEPAGLESEALDVGDCQLQVLPELLVVAAEPGVPGHEPVMLSRGGRAGDVRGWRAPGLAQFRAMSGKCRLKVVLDRPECRATARTLGRLPAAAASARTQSRAWRACSGVGCSAARLMVHIRGVAGQEGCDARRRAPRRCCSSGGRSGRDWSSSSIKTDTDEEPGITSRLQRDLRLARRGRRQ
jgi:hypothetical protein